MKETKLRIHQLPRVKTIGDHLYIKTKLENGNTWQDIRIEIEELLDKITPIKKDKKDKVKLMYQTYSLHFRNSLELEQRDKDIFKQ